MIGKGHGDHTMGKETWGPNGGEMRGNHLPSLGLGQGAGDGMGMVACGVLPGQGKRKGETAGRES